MVDTMMIRLVDHHAPTVRAWERTFADVENVEVIEGDYFATPADAMVSPANSFGIMDGGLDLVIRDTLGFDVRDAQHEHLVSSPSVVREHAGPGCGGATPLAPPQRSWVPPPPPIRSLVCCGLATGIGGMEPARCAAQMRVALEQVRKPARIPSFDQIHRVHAALRMT
ncbi:MAG: Appr-1-p processing protein [Myxococcales bacterium]|nr:Appr-1-p processing protein [Myxococcales bacterium]